MKTGLVLEGGAMRGLFTAGVIDVFLENGITFDGMIGVSAGATFGCNFKSKQVGRTLRYNLKYCRDKRYCSLFSLITTGNLFGADFCYKRIPFELDVFDVDTFLSNPLEFYVVCSDIEKGQPFYYKYEKSDGRDLEYMRASASMPLVSTPVEIDGLKLLDGGMTDSIPLKFFTDNGYNKCVVVLTQPLDYLKKPSKMMPVIKLMMKKYPKMVEAMKNRHSVYNIQKDYVFQCQKQGSVIVIAPESKLPAGRLEKNRSKLSQTYELGRKAALCRIDEIKGFLNDR